MENKNQDECNCGVSRKEKDVILNGIPVKALVCPICGYTIYSGKELQLYFDKKLRDIQEKGDV